MPWRLSPKAGCSLSPVTIWPSVPPCSRRRGHAVRIPHQPLDVLAQQVVAEVAAQDWDEQEVFDCLRRA